MLGNKRHYYNVFNMLTLDCPLLNVNGGVVIYQNITTNSLARIRCNNGFLLQGTPVLKCYRNGTWSDKSPLCNSKAHSLLIKYTNALYLPFYGLDNYNMLGCFF